MTIMPMWKRCHKCHRMYSWNPDVGKMNCPYCGGFGSGNGKLLNILLGGKKKDK